VDSWKKCTFFSYCKRKSSQLTSNIIFCSSFVYYTKIHNHCGRKLKALVLQSKLNVIIHNSYADFVCILCVLVQSLSIINREIPFLGFSPPLGSFPSIYVNYYFTYLNFSFIFIPTSTVDRYRTSNPTSNSASQISS
jgi:hypothetical protein